VAHLEMGRALVGMIMLVATVTDTGGKGISDQYMSPRYTHFAEVEPLLEQVTYPQENACVFPWRRLYHFCGHMRPRQVSILSLDPAYHIGDILLRRGQGWREKAVAVARGPEYNRTVLQRFLVAAGRDFLDARLGGGGVGGGEDGEGGEGAGLTARELRLLALSVEAAGEAKRFEAPRAGDLVVTRRLAACEDPYGDGLAEAKLLDRVATRLAMEDEAAVRRIVVVAAVVTPYRAPRSDHDFRDPRNAALRARLMPLLDQLHGAYPALDLAVRSSADSDGDLFFASRAHGPAMLVGDGQSGFGRVAALVAKALWAWPADEEGGSVNSVGSSFNNGGGGGVGGLLRGQRSQTQPHHHPPQQPSQQQQRGSGARGEQPRLAPSNAVAHLAPRPVTDARKSGGAAAGGSRCHYSGWKKAMVCEGDGGGGTSGAPRLSVGQASPRVAPPGLPEAQASQGLSSLSPPPLPSRLASSSAAAAMAAAKKKAAAAVAEEARAAAAAVRSKANADRAQEQRAAEAAAVLAEAKAAVDAAARAAAKNDASAIPRSRRRRR